MTKILIAVDGSARAAGVFDAAARLARAMNASAVLYRALEPSPDFAPPGASGIDPLPAYLERDARAQLMSLVATAPDVPCELRIEEAAQPWRAILAAAEAAHADLIVIGSHGYHGWDHILGTTAGKVANRAQRNVLVVHEPAPG
jgi:universal stress protein A